MIELADYRGEDCLIYAIGNIGRQDDGLGWAFVDWLEETGLGGGAELVRHYQPFLEHADLISDKRRVLFVDATKDQSVDDVFVEPLVPKYDMSFTSHALSLPAVLAICQQCFGRLPETQLLTIRGYDWELRDGLSDGAKANLVAAKTLFGARYGLDAAAMELSAISAAE